ncbi:MAG: site-2 protease family protein [Candidatus Shapirobacteria bacterium]|jgi:Zn-dependent protease
MANIVSFIALIIAITIHEFSHAFMADRLGDPTPRSHGRLSLNPLNHLDPIGTLMMLVAHFGWGKPVPIDAYNFSHPKRDEMLVALAGPASNLILASILAIVYNATGSSVVYIIALINIYLAIFNLLPVPPLDGSKIFLNLLPQDKSVEWQEAFDRYGIFLLVALIFLPVGGSNLISLIISPIVGFISKVLFIR